MCKIYQYIMMAFVVVTTASCVSEMDETEIEASQHRIQLVGWFPCIWGINYSRYRYT